MGLSIFHFKSSRFSCLSRLIWVCAGEAACGPTGQKSYVTGQRPWSGLTTAESRPRYLRGPAWIGDGSCSRENMLLHLFHNHAKRNNNNSRLRDCAATDSRPDRPDEFLTLPVR